MPDVTATIGIAAVAALPRNDKSREDAAILEDVIANLARQGVAISSPG
jgi:hypothetical protein